MYSNMMASLEEELADIEKTSICCRKLSPLQSDSSSSGCGVKEESETTEGKGNKKYLTTKSKQRNSICLGNTIPNGLEELQDLIDSDSDDDDEKQPPTVQSRVPNPKASGGPEHRPLVGGFAAAAYEAARMDHYKQKGIDVRGHDRPPRSHRQYTKHP